MMERDWSNLGTRGRVKNSGADKEKERPAVPADDVGIGPLPRKLMLSTTMEKIFATLFECNLTPIDHR